MFIAVLQQGGGMCLRSLPSGRVTAFLNPYGPGGKDGISLPLTAPIWTRGERDSYGFISIANPQDPSDGRTIFDGLDETLGHICARNRETETGQVSLAHSIFSRAGLVCKLGWAQDCPIKLALPEDILHTRSINNHVPEEQPAEKVRRGKD